MLTTEIHRDLDSTLDALINDEQIVFQNHSEWGQAKSNRSIMFERRCKNIVNAVKKREHRLYTVMLELNITLRCCNYLNHLMQSDTV